MDLVSLVCGAVVGFVVGVFVYRNNANKLGAIADKVDELYDKVDNK